ncbi:MAG TPA: glycerophosphodiester phosphodiesterase family protein [Candidatus Hydrogenedentes bacterium]|nr:glycerophosphodiester phosphodiesterase family protein [Candidatus Hydrogenedentota bacterium]
MRKTAIFLFLFCVLVPYGAYSTQACAHRGDNKVAPENTIPAFESAVAKKAPMIEFDVQMTKDNALVIMHDATVDRTTNGKGKIVDLTFDEIRALDAGGWFDPKFKGMKVPTLKEVLDVIPTTILCNVHLKNGPGIATATAKVIVDMGRTGHCFLACSKEQIEEVHKPYPDLMVCNMSRQGNDRKAYIDITLASKANFIQLAGVKADDSLAADVARLHAAGVQVNWFHAEDDATIRALAAAGIDFILTDTLDLCQQVLATINQEASQGQNASQK